MEIVKKEKIKRRRKGKRHNIEIRSDSDGKERYFYKDFEIFKIDKGYQCGVCHKSYVANPAVKFYCENQPIMKHISYAHCKPDPSTITGKSCFCFTIANFTNRHLTCSRKIAKKKSAINSFFSIEKIAQINSTAFKRIYL